MKVEYYEEILEQEAINKYLNMIANDYNGELAKIFQEKYINKDKEIEKQAKEINRLHSIIKEAINYIDDNTYYKDHKGHINIDDLYIILKGVDKE